MPTITVKVPGAARKKLLSLPDSLSLEELKEAVKRATAQPLDQIKLVLNGKALQEDKSGGEKKLHLADGDTLISLVAPKAPPSHISSRDGEVEDDEEELRLKLPEGASSLQCAIGDFLKKKLKFPDYLLMVFFWLKLRTWALIFLWILMAPIVQQWELGPIYILFTCFALIFFNLGRREAGEASAYSIFNENFQELPGTLNADRLDQDIRAGQF